MSQGNKWESDAEIQRIREYLRIPSISSKEPPTNYGRVDGEFERYPIIASKSINIDFR